MKLNKKKKKMKIQMINIINLNKYIVILKVRD